jgi:hypothetical protein
MTRRMMTAAAALLAALTTPVAAQRGPAPAATDLPADVLRLMCAPKTAFQMPDRSLRISGGQDSVTRRVWGPGDLITINAGTQNGIEVGQQYLVRRIQFTEGRRLSYENPANIRTAGWIRIYAVDDTMSLATIEYACDTINTGDYLAPFELPVVPRPSTERVKPQRGNYGRILAGNDRRRTFGKGDLFVIDRGSDHGVTHGARFVIYRDKGEAENFLFELGEAVVVEVRPETSTLQGTLSRDAFTSGDYAAIRK